MSKRGRPTVAQKHGLEDVQQLINQGSHKTQRTKTAQLYKAEAFSILTSEAASNIPYLDGIFKICSDPSGDYVTQRDEVIEQLGRMAMQDGMSDEVVIAAATVAAKAYHDGATVKEIKTAILTARKRLKTEAASKNKQGTGE